MISVIAPGGASGGAETTFCVARAGVSRRSGASRRQLAQRDQQRGHCEHKAHDGLADAEHAAGDTQDRCERRGRPPRGAHPERLHTRLAADLAQLVRERERGPPLGVGARDAALLDGFRDAHAAAH